MNDAECEDIMAHLIICHQPDQRRQATEEQADHAQDSMNRKQSRLHAAREAEDTVHIQFTVTE